MTKRFYSSKEAAQELGVSVSTVCNWIREATTFQTDDIGKYAIPERFVRWMKRFSREQIRRHGRPSFGDWLVDHGHRLPKRDELTATTALVVVEQPRKPAKSATRRVAPADRDTELAQLRARMERLESSVRAMSRSEPAKQITASSSTARQIIAKRVRSFVAERSRSISYDIAWNEVYQRFWNQHGQPDKSWWTFIVRHETKLDWFEQTGMIDLLVDAIGGILAEMAAIYRADPLPVAENTTQQELDL